MVNVAILLWWILTVACFTFNTCMMLTVYRGWAFRLAFFANCCITVGWWGVLWAQ